MAFDVSSARFRYCRHRPEFVVNYTLCNWLRRQRRSVGDYRLDRARSGINQIPFEGCLEAESLYRTCLMIQATRDPAPGNDGVRLRDLSRSEVGEITRGLAERVRRGQYMPQVPKLVLIPKPGNRGTRPIRLPGAADHIIATAIHNPLAVGLNRILLPCCHGFRKRCSSWKMLAAIVLALSGAESTILLNDDVRRAFEFVRVEQVLNLLHELGLDTRLIDLIRMLVTVGNDDLTTGIHQGSELSPDLLNVLLHFVLDVPFRDRFPGIQLHRYADNLAMVVPGMTAADAGRYHDEISQLLAAAGMELKREDGGIFDLSRQETTLLGFRLSKPQGRVLVQLPDNVETLVSENLDELVRFEGHSRRRARECLLGWFGSLGPAFQDMDVDQVCTTALQTAGDRGFRDLVPAQELRGRWASAYQRWETMVRTTRGQS